MRVPRAAEPPHRGCPRWGPRRRAGAALVKPTPARFVVFAPNWLGDAVMALPAIADVRRAAPDASLTIAARQGIAPLFSLVPGIDDVLVLEKRGRESFSW